LSACSLRDSDAQYLSKALETNPTITSLDLSGNQFGAPGFMHLGQLLKANPYVVKFTLRSSAHAIDLASRKLLEVRVYPANLQESCCCVDDGSVDPEKLE